MRFLVPTLAITTFALSSAVLWFLGALTTALEAGETSPDPL